MPSTAKDAAYRGVFQTKAGSNGYPPDLDSLVNGVDVGAKKMRFLRRIPVDPMTGGTDWDCILPRMILNQILGTATPPLTLYTKSHGTALDGTKYKNW